MMIMMSKKIENNIDYWHQKYLDKVQELDKALDFIVEREEDNDYICEILHDKDFDVCADTCRNLNKDCVLRFLKYYNKEK